jgi:Ner family transcriptional regulator
VTGTPTHVWDRHSILAEIKRRYGSLNEFAATTEMDAAHFSVALAAPYPKAERVIAGALGVPRHHLWPDRYDADGRRLSTRSRPKRSKASRKAEGEAA